MNLQQILLPPLKTALADSLQLVFAVAMYIIIAGVFVSLSLGDSKAEKQIEQSVLEEAGITLFAEGMSVEGEIAAELVPDLIKNRRIPQHSSEQP